MRDEDASKYTINSGKINKKLIKVVRYYNSFFKKVIEIGETTTLEISRYL